MAVFCEHDTEPSGSAKAMNFLTAFLLCIQKVQGSDVGQKASCLELIYSWNSSKSNTGIAPSNRPRHIFPHLFQFIIPKHPQLIAT
jgi:hypothetical protein